MFISKQLLFPTTIKFFISILLPTIVVSEIGFRDFLIGQTELSKIDDYCTSKDKNSYEGLEKLFKKFECYGEDNYTFTFDSTDGNVISHINVSSNTKFPPTFYVDKTSTYWELRHNLSKKYKRLDCNRDSVEKVVLNDRPLGRDYYISQSDDGKLQWVKLIVFDNIVTTHHSWMITYTDENHLKGKTQTEIYQSDCRVKGFGLEEF